MFNDSDNGQTQNYYEKEIAKYCPEYLLLMTKYSKLKLALMEISVVWDECKKHCNCMNNCNKDCSFYGECNGEFSKISNLIWEKRNDIEQCSN